MPTVTVTTKFWEFDQNNSGGSFEIDDAKGIGPSVWIEALSLDDACSRAESIGIYFDGCDTGRDCPCCGDRWHRPWRDDGAEAPGEGYNGTWHDTAYVHRLDGSIERIKAGD